MQSIPVPNQVSSDELQIQKRPSRVSRHNKIMKVVGLGVGAQISKFRIRVKRDIVFTTTAPRPASGATHPPIQYISGAHYK